MDRQLQPVITRGFTGIGAGPNIDLIKSRPGYDSENGGPTLTSGHNTHDQLRTRPSRLYFATGGTIVLRYILGKDKTTGNTMYWDDPFVGYAGLMTDCDADMIIASGSSAGLNVTIGWPR